MLSVSEWVVERNTVQTVGHSVARRQETVPSGKRWINLELTELSKPGPKGSVVPFRY